MAHSSRSDKIRLLLIEDEAPLVRIVGLTLSTEPDFEFTAAESGAVGLQRAANGLFDLVLMDVHLGDIDGTDLLAKLRATLDVPVVVFSASSERKVEEEYMSKGATAFIAKPFDPTTFASKLRAIVASREAGA